MRSRLLLVCLALLAACGGDGADGAPPPPDYELFRVELDGLAEGARVVPGQALTLHTRYAGPLVRDLTFTARFTHEASGESDAFTWRGPLEDTARIDLRTRWNLRHPFLLRPGRIRVQLEAAVTSTRNGSAPWVTQSAPVYVDLQPRIDRVTVRAPLPGQVVPYGTPLTVEVQGQDLWDTVALGVSDVGAAAPVPGLALALPFDGSQASLARTWTLRAPHWERPGTYPVQVTARYGTVVATSEPLAFEVTHSLDTVTLLLRGPDGALGAPTLQPLPRLADVRELVLRIAGTQLAGKALRVDGGAEVVAPADAFELTVRAPRDGDFEDGKGTHTYAPLLTSGGMERRREATLQRWGIERCGWRTADGAPLAEGTPLDAGVALRMHAELWGFPDTTTRLLVFKSPVAHFQLWERDSGRDPSDVFANHDDELEEVDADVRSSRTEAPWTTRHDEELAVLGGNRAEVYFELALEDQRCTSGTVQVRPPPP